MTEEVKIKTGRAGPPPLRSDREYINPTLEDQMEIYGYRSSLWRKIIVWFSIIITVGLVRLFFFWLPHLYVKATNRKCSLAEATTVILRDQYLQWFVSEVKMEDNDNQRKTYVGKTGNDAVTPIKYEAKYTSSTPLQMADHKSSEDDIVPDNPVDDVLKRNANVCRYFITKKVKYLWDREKNSFQKLRGLDFSTRCSFFHYAKGLSNDEKIKRIAMYGSNSIQIHVTPIIRLLFKEVLSPFYIFQIFSCAVWFADEYTYYASCIVVISVVSITVTIFQTRAMQRALRNTIQSSTIVTKCIGGDEYVDICSDDLVPGDILSIPKNGCILQCDAVLITGNCIVNESMLTGESVPVTKTPLPNPKLSRNQEDIYYNIKEHSRHTLFCGTHVLQTRYYGNQPVKAVVVRTGFATAKGELVRSILYPKPVDFKFNRDTYIFVLVLAFIALIGFIYTIVRMVHDGETAGDIILRSLDLITIAVPPALPAALTIGIVFAQRRLKLSKIFCISPRSINVSGTINAVCFDKTGTLTEDGLDMHSVVPVHDGKFSEEIHNMCTLQLGPMLTGMAACHSLTIIDGHLTGDPLEMIMFDATGWSLEEPGEEETKRYDMLIPTIVKPSNNSKSSGTFDENYKPLSDEVGIMRQFTFTSALQRMSVITRKLGAQNFELYTKGAPEMIASLSKPETVPDNFHETLLKYTQHGYRVLALAYRPLPAKIKYAKIQRIQREQVERALTFLGLLVMENRLKEQTTPVIKNLRNSDIRTIMVTGDNMLTALSVARECGMVDPQDNIVLVQAFPGVDNKSGPWIEYMYTDEDSKKTVEITTSNKEVDTILHMDSTDPYFHFAMDGKSWAIIRQQFPGVLQRLCVRGTVFARMSPDQKAQLIEELQELGYYVGMCGDGANDCGALKTAHAGISLSEAEASVASPFTSKSPNIECVPTLIREGRAALVTSFGIFKYMALYSLTQFISVCILYWISSNLTDPEFMYIDLFLLTTLSVTFGFTAAYPKLTREAPLLKLFSISPILSIILHVIISMGPQIFCYFNVMEQPWFVKFVDNEDDDYTSYENMAVFTISMYQYITLAVVFSTGKPFRKTIFSNYIFTANLLVCIAASLWVTIYPTDGLADFMELKPAPSIPYRFLYIGIAAANFVLAFLVEMFIIDSYFVKYTMQHWIEDIFSNSLYQYEILENEIRSSKSWPPVSTSESLADAFVRMDSHHVRDFDQSSLLSSLLDSASDTHSIRSLRSLEFHQTSAEHSVPTNGNNDVHTSHPTKADSAIDDLSSQPPDYDGKHELMNDNEQDNPDGIDNPGFNTYDNEPDTGHSNHAVTTL